MSVIQKTIVESTYEKWSETKSRLNTEINEKKKEKETKQGVYRRLNTGWRSRG